METRSFLAFAFLLLGGAQSLVFGCSSETPDSAGSGGSAGANAGASSGAMTGGAGGASGAAAGGAPAGAASGGAAGAAVGGVSPGGMGGSAGSGGASAGAAGSSADGGMGGAGSGGAPPAGASGAGGAMAGAGGMSGTAGSGGAAGSGAFALTSPDHMNGAVFADPYTCAEAGFMNSILPELHWTAGPPGTMSYAITFIDVTLAPEDMNGYHWVIWNIPANVLTLPEAFKDQASIGAQENRDFLGPCPNIGGSGNTDTYEFTIYALSQASITVMGSGTTAVRNAEMMLEADNLAKAKLTGTSSASPP